MLKKLIAPPTFLFLFGLVLNPPLPAQAGSISSGGGSVVVPQPGSEPLLLDLFVAEPRFRDRHELALQRPLRKTRFLEVVGYERMKIADQPTYALAVGRVKAWQASSPTTIGLVLQAMERMQFHYTLHRLAVSSEYMIPDDLKAQYPDLKVSAAILYSEKLGATLSAPVWNSLGDYSQAGLMIHEALRHVQITYKQEISNEKLQKITATILLRNPRDGETLDSEEYVDGELLEDIKSQRYQAGLKVKYQKDLCTLLTQQASHLITDETAWRSRFEMLTQSTGEIPDKICAKWKTAIDHSGPKMLEAVPGKAYSENCNAQGKAISDQLLQPGKKSVILSPKDPRLMEGFLAAALSKDVVSNDQVRNEWLELIELLNQRYFWTMFMENKYPAQYADDFLKNLGAGFSKLRDRACTQQIDVTLDSMKAFDSGVEFYVNLFKPADETAQALQRFSYNDNELAMSLIASALGANNAAWIDLGHSTERIFPELGEDTLRDYIEGRRKGISWKGRSALKKLVKALQEYNKTLLDKGIYIRVE